MSVITKYAGFRGTHRGLRADRGETPYGVRDFPVIAPYTDTVARTDLGAKLAAAEWMTKDVDFSLDLSLSVSLASEFDQLRLFTPVT